MFVASDGTVDRDLLDFVRSHEFRNLERETKRSYTTDIRPLLTFLSSRRVPWRRATRTTGTGGAGPRRTLAGSAGRNRTGRRARWPPVPVPVPVPVSVSVPVPVRGRERQPTGRVAEAGFEYRSRTHGRSGPVVSALLYVVDHIVALNSI